MRYFLKLAQHLPANTLGWGIRTDIFRMCRFQLLKFPKQMVVFSKNGHWKPKYYEVYSRVEERLFRSWAYFCNELFIFRPLKPAMRKEVAI